MSDATTNEIKNEITNAVTRRTADTREPTT